MGFNSGFQGLNKPILSWDLILIYLLTAIGLTPGGSSTVHIYTKTMDRTTQLIGEECGPCPVFASYTLAFALQLRKKHGKTSVRVEKPNFLYNINLLVIVKKTRALCGVHTDLSVTVNMNFSFQTFNLL